MGDRYRWGGGDPVLLPKPKPRSHYGAIAGVPDGRMRVRMANPGCKPNGIGIVRSG